MLNHEYVMGEYPFEVRQILILFIFNRLIYIPREFYTAFDNYGHYFDYYGHNIDIVDGYIFSMQSNL